MSTQKATVADLAQLVRNWWFSGCGPRPGPRDRYDREMLRVCIRDLGELFDVPAEELFKAAGIPEQEEAAPSFYSISLT